MEEALRLAVLPGESAGRIYYFSSIRITGLPADGDRQAWLSLFQRALAEAAGGAMHGADRRAETATAVFFRSRQEALEILLRRVLARRPLREWFWPTVLTATDAGSPVAAVPAIVEALRMLPAGWAAVAAALFAAPGIDAVEFLEAIPASRARAWLAEIDTGRRPFPAHARPANRPLAQAAMRAALRAFGLASPRTEWFAAMAVLRESPADLTAGTLAARARLVLCDLLPEAAAPRPIPRRIAAPIAAAAAPSAASPPSVESPAVPETTAAPTDSSDSSDSSAAPVDAGCLAKRSWEISEAKPVSTPEAGDAEEAGIVPDGGDTAGAPIAWLEGAATAAGGLFFLLNVLARIGMPEAMASGLAANDPDFLRRLLLHFTRLAGIPPTDPVVGWLESQLEEDGKTESPSRAVRSWAVAVRRWCWRTGKISAGEIVRRPALFAVNRTDIDVSLPLDEAEIRIRRAGLDLDPGWLPWFGWVVRFHYSYRGRLDA